MGKQKTGGYDLITPGVDSRGQSDLERWSLELDQQEANKKRKDKLKAHLAQYASDPVSQALATAEFEMQERDAAKAAQKAEYDQIVQDAKDQFPDDPYAQANHVAMNYVRQQTAPEAQKAFAEGERLAQIKERDKTARKLENIPIVGRFSPLREAVGAAVETVPRMASILARVSDAATGEKAADEANRQAQRFGEARDQAREEDVSPYLSRQFGGAAQSFLQMLATPGGAYSKIFGTGAMAGNEGLTTAEDAGLKGAAKLRYAGTQGLLEAGIAAISQKLFGPGIESRLAGQSVAARTFKELAKNFGKDVAKEIPEEELTTVLQDLSSKFEGVSPDMTPGDFVNNAVDTLVQTIMMGGMGQALDAGRNKLSNMVRSRAKEPTPPPMNPEEQTLRAQAALTRHPDLQDLYSNANPQQQASIEREALRREQARVSPEQAAGSADVGSQLSDLVARIPPALAAFMKTPSTRNYEAALKAGMPALGNTNRPTRSAFTKGLKDQAEGKADPSGLQKLVAQMTNPAGTAPENVATIDSAPEVVSGEDEQMRIRLRDLLEGSNDEEGSIQGQGQQQEGIQAGQEGYQAGQRQEGLLTTPVTRPEGNQGQAAGVAAVEQSPPPASQYTPETFEQAYRAALDAMFKSPAETEPVEQLAALYDMHPDWADAVDQKIETETSPAIAPGTTSPGQPTPSKAGPVSPSEPESITYHSGLSRSPAEMDAAIKDKKPVGVSAFQSLTQPVRKRLVKYANEGGKVFVDSGAFTAFMKGREVNWDDVLFSYRELIGAVKPEKRDNITIVAPDVVGDHQATMDLHFDLRDTFEELMGEGSSVIFPVQKEEGKTLAAGYVDLTNVFGDSMDHAIVGVPYNAKAWSQEDVLEFMRTRDMMAKQFGETPRRFHLLGGGETKVKALIEAAQEEGLSLEGISGDAMPKTISARRRGDKKPAAESQAIEESQKLTESPGPSQFTPAFKKLPAKSQKLFNDAWDANNADAFKNMLYRENKGLRGEFEARTGVQLPKSKKGTDEAIDRYFAEQTEKPVAEKKPRKTGAAEGRSLRSQVISQGGIASKALQKDYNIDELRQNGLLTIMRADGLPIDMMAQTLETSGYLRTPEGRNPSDWLMEQLVANADVANAEYTDKEIEKQLRKEYEAHEALKQLGLDEAGIEELRGRSEEAGIRAADEGEPDEGPITDEELEVIDTSFDFGANVKAEEEFKLEQPKKPRPSSTFEDNDATKQGSLFDAGKNDLEGQQLLFNTDPGDMNNPRTQENRPTQPAAAEPSQEDMMEAILREELLGQKPAAASQPEKTPAQSQKKPRKPRAPKAEPEARRGKVGDKLASGEVVITSSGRRTTPFPKVDVSTNKKAQNTIRAVNQWLRYNAIQEAIARGDKFNATQFQAEDPKNIPPASKDSMEEYLFGQQPNVVPDITKPLAPKTRTEKAKDRTADTAKELDDAVKNVADLFGGEVLGSTGFSPEQMRAIARLVKAAFDHKISQFAEFVAFVQDRLGDPLARKLASGIELAWRTLKRLDEYKHVDDAGSVIEILDQRAAAASQKTQRTGWDAVPGHFAEQLSSGKAYRSIVEARKEAGEILGQPIKPGTPEAQTLEEYIERGIVQVGRNIVEEGGTPGQIFDKLVDLYTRQPILGTRDTTKMELQAYSTPVPLAFLASRLAGITKEKSVVEPTAGNGMLLIETQPGNTFANELDPLRAAALEEQGFNVTTNDATKMRFPKVEVAIANPPFGKVKNRERTETIEFNVDGLKTKEIDHAIALQTLKALKPGGTAVLIIAAKGHDAKNDMERRQAYALGAARPFYDALYEGHDVVEHFTVDGSLYSRQGAGFPVDVIVVRPLGTVPVDQKRATPWGKVPRIFESWGELKNAFFFEVANNDQTTDGTGIPARTGDNGNPDLSTRDADSVGRVPGQNANSPQMAEGDVRASKPESGVSGTLDATNGSGRTQQESGRPRPDGGVQGDARGQRSDAGSVSDGDRATTRSGGIDSGTRPDGMAGTGTTEPEVDADGHQAEYVPSSTNKTVETLIPTNLADATAKALQAVAEERGPIDEFVRKELGYEKNDPFFKDLSAEQVDALALAIHAHKKGSGMIIGDMTGVGKGRVAAGIMRYAERQKLVPVFVTEKPDLFGDIYRDLGDVGADTAENPFFAVTTNNTSGQNAIELPNGRKLSESKETNQAWIDEGLTSLADGKGFTVKINGKPQKINALFTMYSQMQTVKGNDTHRRAQLRRLMPNAFLILDESHNAGGSVKTRVNENAPLDRAAYVRDIVQMAKGVMYSSATFAKRPDVMDLYSKTDMALAVDGDITKLAAAVKNGGLPLQQVLSSMLAEAGQYIRREKTFKGIEFAKVDVGVDLEEQDKITGVFRQIRSLDSVMDQVVEVINGDLIGGGQGADAGDRDQRVTATNFGSILWNAVDQMLFALKADKAADEAIAAWKAGEVPLMAIDNTLETILDEYVDANGLGVGDEIKLNFRDVLLRYLERSRWITVDTGVRKPNGQRITEKRRLTDAELDVETDKGNALEMFNAAKALISQTNINAPASPIDWIRHRMEKAGMKIAEVTGRKLILKYNDAGKAVLAKRPRTETGTKGKQNTIRQLNEGTLDGILLNRSGSTGLSAHASAKFKNQKVRHMIIVQAAKNIDEFMQMLGRVNRTGQVVKPRYSLLMSDSPAELRPAAVLAKKLASLNASVTAKSKGAVGFTVTDVMNEVGGAVVEEYLNENPEIAMALEMNITAQEDDEDNQRDQMSEAESLEDLVRVATGRSSILPIAQQREFWEEVTQAYNRRIEELNATNSNPLIAQTMDLQAKTLSTSPLFEGGGGDSPFSAPAQMERVDAKVLGKPMSPDEIKARLRDFYGTEDISDLETLSSQWQEKAQADLLAAIQPYRDYALSRVVTDEAREQRLEVLGRQFEAVTNAMRAYPPGMPVRYYVDGIPYDGVVIGFSRGGGKSGNPTAPSRWYVDIAVNDAARKLSVPVSRGNIERRLGESFHSLESYLRGFAEAQSVSRQRRYIGTGNLVAAYARLVEQRGRFVFYTDDAGNTKRGILMPQNFNVNAFIESRPVVMRTADDVLRVFDAGATILATSDGILQLIMRNNSLVLVAPGARARGSKYTLSRAITDAAGRDFVATGNQQVITVSDRGRMLDTLAAVLGLSPIEARLESQRTIARDALGLTRLGQQMLTEQPAQPEQPQQPQSASDVAREELRQIQDQNQRHIDTLRRELGRTDNLGSGLPFNREMSNALSGLLLGKIKEGVKRFEIFVRDHLAKAGFTNEQMQVIKPRVIRTWNAVAGEYGLDVANEDAFNAIEAAAAADAVSGAPAATPEKATADPATSDRKTRKPAAKPEGETYSTKNAFTDREREKLGMGQRVPWGPASREEQISQARDYADTADGIEFTEKLIRELANEPRATTVLENDMLLQRKARLSQKRKAVMRTEREARATGNDVQAARAEAESLDLLNQQKQLVEILSEGVSYALGSQLQARKAEIDEEYYSVPVLVMEWEAAHGKKLDPKSPEFKAIQERADKLEAEMEALKKLLADETMKVEDLQKKLAEAHDALLAARSQTTESEFTPPPREPSRTEKLYQEGKEQVENAFKKLRSFTFGAGVPQGAYEVLVELAAGFTKMGVVTLSDFLSRIKKRLGPQAEAMRDTAIQAWRSIHPAGSDTVVESILRKINVADSDSIGRAARKLHAYVIERDALTGSAEDRDAAVDAVHEILQEVVPEWTRDDTQRAMSGIGIFSPLSQDAIEVVRRDQKAQLLLLEQAKSWEAREAPPKTGREHGEISDEQRRLRRVVNELKRAAGIVETTEAQLRSALDAAKRAAENRIRDLEEAIRTNTRIPGRRSMVDGNDPDLKALRDRRDELQKEYNATFGRPELTDEQRLARAEKAVARAVDQIQNDLASGRLYGRPRPTPLTSTALEAKQAELDALKALREEMRVRSGQAQARSDAQYERVLKEREAEMARRIAEKDYAPAPKKPPRELTPEMLKRMQAIDKLKREFDRDRADWVYQNQPVIFKAVHGARATAATIRKVLTTVDMSLVGRQGIMLGMTNPAIYKKAISNGMASDILKSLSIFPSEDDLFRVQAELDSDPAAVRLEKIGKLAVTDVHGGVRREEGHQFTPEWVNKMIPGIGGSERSGSAFINTLRRLTFRSFAEKLGRRLDGKDKRLSNADLRVLGHFINVSTGRASVGQWASTLAEASVVFFSPQWWASRLLMLTGQPIWHNLRDKEVSWETRVFVAQEWAKQMGVMAAMTGLAFSGLYLTFGPPGEDEEWEYYWNPFSPNAGSFRVGHTIIDMTAGLGQHVSYFMRMASGKQADRWETREVSKMEVFEKYVRGKLSPIASMVGDYLAGASMSGDKFGSGAWVARHVSPLIAQDVWDAANRENPAMAATVMMMVFFGLNADAKEARFKERKDAVNEARAYMAQGKTAEAQDTIREHLAKVASDEAKEALKTATDETRDSIQKVVDRKDSPELDQAIEREKGDLTLIASLLLSSEDPTKTKSATGDAATQNARQLLKIAVPTYDEALKLYDEAYKRRNGSLTEVVGKQGEKRRRTKPNVATAKRRLRLLYSDSATK